MSQPDHRFSLNERASDHDYPIISTIEMQKMIEAGAKFTRASVHPDLGWLLIEGWNEEPESEDDLPEPSFNTQEVQHALEQRREDMIKRETEAVTWMEEESKKRERAMREQADRVRKNIEEAVDRALARRT